MKTKKSSIRLIMLKLSILLFLTYVFFYAMADDEIRLIPISSGPALNIKIAESPAVMKPNQIADMNIQVLTTPEGYLPLGMLNRHQGYFFQAESPQVLWLYDYERNSFQAELDYRSSEITIAEEIALSDSWLVWLELEPYRPNDEGALRRNVRLMTRLRQKPEANRVIDVGYTTPSDGFFLPFDSLALDGSKLVYRYSVFHSGKRDSFVKYVDLETGKIEMLAGTTQASGKTVLGCDVSGNQVTWDVQYVYEQPLPRAPSLTLSTHSIYLYHLLTKELTQLSDNLVYYSPVLHRETLYAVMKHAPRLTKFGYDTSIVEIDPSSRSVKELVRHYEYSRKLFQRYYAQDIPRGFYRDQPHVGQRLLSWQSNVFDEHIVFDLTTYMFVELPLYFSDIDSDFPEDYWMEPIFGLDADYLLFGRTFGHETPYLLRIE